MRTMQPRTVPGKPPKLDAEGFAWLVAVANGSPRVCGIDADRWTNARLRLVVEARYGVNYIGSTGHLVFSGSVAQTFGGSTDA